MGMSEEQAEVVEKIQEGGNELSDKGSESAKTARMLA